MPNEIRKFLITLFVVASVFAISSLALGLPGFLLMLSSYGFIAGIGTAKGTKWPAHGTYERGKWDFSRISNLVGAFTLAILLLVLAVQGIQLWQLDRSAILVGHIILGSALIGVGAALALSRPGQIGIFGAFLFAVIGMISLFLGIPRP